MQFICDPFILCWDSISGCPDEDFWSDTSSFRICPKELKLPHQKSSYTICKCCALRRKADLWAWPKLYGSCFKAIQFIEKSLDWEVCYEMIHIILLSLFKTFLCYDRIWRSKAVMCISDTVAVADCMPCTAKVIMPEEGKAPDPSTICVQSHPHSMYRAISQFRPLQGESDCNMSCIWILGWSYRWVLRIGCGRMNLPFRSGGKSAVKFRRSVSSFPSSMSGRFRRTASNAWVAQALVMTCWAKNTDPSDPPWGSVARSSVSFCHLKRKMRPYTGLQTHETTSSTSWTWCDMWRRALRVAHQDGFEAFCILAKDQGKPIPWLTVWADQEKLCVLKASEG